ncbi:kinase-like protein [Gigaspora margarita]|uniref:Kinase-like protein n=1 Tax=Gigaspora margarita TaxID=4874 RepID=A0A8H3XFH4_GIGMA|nr:kinase-like protein [Gigaspora margarita]
MSNMDLFEKIEFGEKFEYASFEDKEEIGKGRFGVMYKAYLKDKKQIVALKTLYYYDENSLDDLVKKVKYKIKHENIIQFLGITQDSENKTYIVLQYANNGDLRCYLNDCFSELDWSTKIRIAKEISSGINCLHNADVVHRDLHDKNILSSDIYSLGVLFWELSSGVPPFRALKAVHAIKGDREIPIEGTPVDFKNLYEAAWNGNPNSRPDIQEICKKLEHMQLEPVYKDLFKELRLKYASFENKIEIGKGRFGVMYKAYFKDIKQFVALKTLYYCDENSLCNLVRKVKYTVKHDNVIQFYGITQDYKADTYMVLQYADSGDLEHYLNAHFSELDWSAKIRMAREISSGIKCLHGVNIVHRNLHDKNILVYDDGRMIITDFGLSESSESSDNSITSTIHERWEYSDPQYLQNPHEYKWDKYSDIYSLGVLFWELSSGISPFKALNAVHVIKGNRENPIEGTPDDFKNLYCAAWKDELNSRPDIKEICKKLDNMQLDLFCKELFKKNTSGQEFEYTSFKNKEEIGKGGFGVIYKAHSKDVNKIVALKTLDHNDEHSLDDFIREVESITKVNDDNVIQFFGITQDYKADTYYMVLQYADSGDLEHYLNAKFSELDWSTKIRMAKEISSGIDCLHNANIVHRDLHDKNILVHGGRMIITDFGLSLSLDKDTLSITSRVYGRCEYSDPKYLPSPREYKWDKHSDIYSLGVLFWELSSGVAPFKAFKNRVIRMSMHLIRGNRETPIKGTPVDFKDIYNDAWGGDPNSRPDIRKICEKLNYIRLEQDSEMN